MSTILVVIQFLIIVPASFLAGVLTAESLARRRKK